MTTISDYVYLISLTENSYPADSIVTAYISNGNIKWITTSPLDESYHPMAEEISALNASSSEEVNDESIEGVILFIFDGGPAEGTFMDQRSIPEHIVRTVGTIEHAMRLSYPVLMSFYIADGAGQSLENPDLIQPVHYSGTGAMKNMEIQSNAEEWEKSKGLTSPCELSDRTKEIIDNWTYKDTIESMYLWLQVAEGKEVDIDHLIAFAQVNPESTVNAILRAMCDPESIMPRANDYFSLSFGKDTYLKPHWGRFLNVHDTIIECANNSTGMARTVMVTMIAWSRWAMGEIEDAQKGLLGPSIDFDHANAIFRHTTKDHPWSQE